MKGKEIHKVDYYFTRIDTSSYIQIRAHSCLKKNAVLAAQVFAGEGLLKSYLFSLSPWNVLSHTIRRRIKRGNP